MSKTKAVLKKGSKGPAVKELQMLLNAHLASPKIEIDSDFGPSTKTAVEAFQKKNKLDDDGVVGSDTWKALLAHAKVKQLYKYPPGPQESLSAIAVPYIGATESQGNKMGSDPQMQEIFKADKYAPNGATDGYPWCCAFVSMCVQKLIDKSSYYLHVKKPYTPSVTLFRTSWAPAQNCLLFTPKDKNYSPHTGDIVVFTFSHIGIVESVTKEGSVNTIEGNTNEAGSREGTIVRRKIRRTSQIRYFIRLPVPENYDFKSQICFVNPLEYLSPYSSANPFALNRPPLW